MRVLHIAKQKLGAGVDENRSHEQKTFNTQRPICL
jgi:hypothetical protein